MFRWHPVLVVCEEQETRDQIARAIVKHNLRPVCCFSLQDARSLLAREDFSVVFCSDLLPDGDFRDVTRVASRTGRSAPLVILSRRADWDAYLGALRAGAFDSIACPPDFAETERVLQSALLEASRKERGLQAVV
jgi:DNA-binding NtrC family response regulator